MTRTIAAILALALAGFGCATPAMETAPLPGPAVVDQSGGDWPAYGGAAEGTRYSALDEIDTGNVARLERVWTYRTGDLPENAAGARTRFETTPIVVWGTMYISTPFNRVVALDPETGEARWTFDSRPDLGMRYSEDLISRGVSAWEDPDAAAGSPCARRIILATLDARIFALDATTGQRCSAFGDAGTVELKTPDVGRIRPGQYMVTSPPAIANGAIIVGSAVGDNGGVELERGIVRGFDARTGAQLWQWDPIPRSPASQAASDWEPESARRTGAANAWAPISADAARGLVFVPTGSASPDYFGGERPGGNRHANSVVALRARTGEVVWSFQVVHHDLWDYDVASQPLLTDLTVDGRTIPVVVQATKMGHIFVLHRETGEPVFAVEERPVPPSDVPGETAWPTQPFPERPAPLHPAHLDPDSVFGLTPEDRAYCRERIAGMRNEGIFTPPSLRGTVVYPGFVGGVNWGSAAYARESQTLVVALNRLPFWVRLLPRDSVASFRARYPEPELAAQAGTPFAMARGTLLAPSLVPCSPPPWSELVAVDLGTGEVRWRAPLGIVPALAERNLPGHARWGSITLGGPLATGGGLAFIGASMDPTLRAFDLATGALLWEEALPVPAQATPMTFRGPRSGKQFIVIAAGGHGRLGTAAGDYLVAYALR